MDIKDAYKAPDSDVSEYAVKPPKPIRVAYFLIFILIVIGVTDSFLLFNLTNDDLEFEITFLVLYVFLTFLISWFLYRPIRDRSKKSWQLPLFLIVFNVALKCSDIYEGTFMTENKDITGIIELGIMVAIYFLIVSAAGKRWCNQGFNK